MIEVTCKCGRVLQAPDKAAGKKGRCKNCGAVLSVPDASESSPPWPAQTVVDDPPSMPDILPELPEDDAQVSPGPSNASMPSRQYRVSPGRDAWAPPGRSKIDESERERLPREPWYYSVVQWIAAITLSLALLQFGLVCKSSLDRWNEIQRLKIADELATILFLPVGISFAGLVFTTLVTGLVFVFVDGARNIRVMRYRLEG